MSKGAKYLRVLVPSLPRMQFGSIDNDQDNAKFKKELQNIESSIKEIANKLAAFDKDELSRKYEDRLQ
jgi:hypothetical protein